MLLESVHRLIHECDTICEKQNWLHPVRPHEHVAEGNHGPCFPCPRGHDEQRLPVVVPFEGLRDSTNGARLIETLDDLSVDFRCRQRFPAAPTLNRELELCFFVEALHRPWRVIRVVPEP